MSVITKTFTGVDRCGTRYSRLNGSGLLIGTGTAPDVLPLNVVGTLHMTAASTEQYSGKRKRCLSLRFKTSSIPSILKPPWGTGLQLSGTGNGEIFFAPPQPSNRWISQTLQNAPTASNPGVFPNSTNFTMVRRILANDLGAPTLTEYSFGNTAYVTYIVNVGNASTGTYGIAALNGMSAATSITNSFPVPIQGYQGKNIPIISGNATNPYGVYCSPVIFTLPNTGTIMPMTSVLSQNQVLLVPLGDARNATFTAGVPGEVLVGTNPITTESVTSANGYVFSLS